MTFVPLETNSLNINKTHNDNNSHFLKEFVDKFHIAEAYKNLVLKTQRILILASLIPELYLLTGCNIIISEATAADSSTSLNTESANKTAKIAKPKPLITPEPSKTPDTGISSTSIEKKINILPAIPEKKVIHEIDVYGDETALNKTQLDALNKVIESTFNSNIKELSDKSGIEVPKKQEDKLNLLYPNIRRAQYTVTQSVYQKFQERAKEDGVDFVEWVKYHILRTNQILQNLDPPTKLRLELARIIVVNDDFPTKKPKFSDIDGQSDISLDPYKENLAYTNTVKLADGRNILLDEGEIHEGLHLWFSYLDEYTQEDFPSFSISSLEGPGNSTNGWLGYYLKDWIEAGKIRGYYADSRGVGIAGYHDIPHSAYQVWNERPANISLHFKNSQGNDITGKLTIAPASRDKDYYSPKQYPTSEEAPFNHGKFIFGENFFTPELKDGQKNIIYRNLWRLNFTPKIGEMVTLYFPASAFNMSALAGMETSANYEIKLFSVNKPLPPNQELQIIKQNDPYIPNGWQIYASMNIIGTNWKYIWLVPN